MMIGRATKEDIDDALKVLGWLHAIERGDMPECVDADGDEWFDCDDGDQCRRVIDGLLDILNTGGMARVIWGMATVCSPKNAIINPDADTLELHPRIKKALEAQESTAA